MPFKSEAQLRFMWMKHPELAKRWSDEMKAAGEPAVQPNKKSFVKPDKRKARNGKERS